MARESKSSESVGFGGLLFIAFLVLKLCGVIAWSWWWITAPLWAPAAFAVVAIAIVGSVALTRRRH